MSLTSLTDQRIRIAQSMADRAVDPNQIRALLGRLTEQVRTGVLPPYGGIPIIQTLTQKLSQMQNAQGVAQARQNAQRPPIAQEVMQQAQGAEGVAALPTNLPAEGMAGGGIVAFEDGGKVERYQNQGYVAPTPAGRAVNAAATDFVSYLQAENLRKRLADQYGVAGSDIAGLFVSQTDAQRKAAQQINELLPHLNYGQLQQLAVEGPRALSSLTAAAAAPAAAAPAAAAVAPLATPAVPPPSSMADRLRGDAIDSRSIGTAPAIPFFTPGEFSLPQAGAPNVRLPKVNLPAMPTPTDFEGAIRDLPDKLKQVVTEKTAERKKELEDIDAPGFAQREASIAKREADIDKTSAITQALNMIKLGGRIAGSKERTLAGAFGNEGVKGIEDLIQGAAANRAAKERLEDFKDNLAQQRTAAKKGNLTAADVYGQKAGDDLRSYTALKMQAAQAKSAEAGQLAQLAQAGALGKAGLEQSGILGLAGLQEQAAGRAQQGQLGLMGLQMQMANLNQQTAYYNALIAQKDKQISIADAATKAKYLQQRNVALKQFEAGEGQRLSRQLSQQYGKQWQIGEDELSRVAQKLYESARASYLMNALNEFEVASDRRGGGVREAESLIGGGQ